MKRGVSAALVFGLLLVLVGCGGGGEAAAGNGGTSVEIKASEFAYDPSMMTVNKGESVTVKLSNIGSVAHDFVIDELNVNISQVPVSSTESATFTASSAGTFTYYCSVPGHLEAGMKGTITVQ